MTSPSLRHNRPDQITVQEERIAAGFDSVRERHQRVALLDDIDEKATRSSDLDCGQASLTYRGYCPNAETLRELRGERPVNISLS
ncbi:hypothetical protein [Microvirga sp. P5_D2]